MLLCSRRLSGTCAGLLLDIENAAYACWASKLRTASGVLARIAHLYLAGCGCCRPQAAASLLHMAASLSALQAWSHAVPIPHRECKPGAKWPSHCLQAWASPGPVQRRRHRTGVNRTGVTMQKKRQREMREAQERAEAAKAQRSQQAQQVRPG